MISSTVIKISAPVARSSLIFISLGIAITSIFIILYAIEYPYLFGKEEGLEQFYIEQSKSIPITFSIYSAIGIIVALSTVYASYRGKAGYTLAHAGFIGIFVPALIAAYFLTRPHLHSPERYVDDGFVDNYKIDNKSPVDPLFQSMEPNKRFKEMVQNKTDELQQAFECCGFHKMEEWEKRFDGFIPASCCQTPSNRKQIKASDKSDWVPKHWPLDDEDFIIEYCDTKLEKELPGCRDAFKEFEDNKSRILGLLTGLLGILCTADGVLSLLTYALIHTEHECKIEETELDDMSTIGQETDPELLAARTRPSISSIRNNSNEAIAARALAVRFNLSNSPRQSISGPSKFSLAARRQSSYI